MSARYGIRFPPPPRENKIDLYKVPGNCTARSSYLHNKNPLIVSFPNQKSSKDPKVKTELRTFFHQHKKSRSRKNVIPEPTLALKLIHIRLILFMVKLMVWWVGKESKVGF